MADDTRSKDAAVSEDLPPRDAGADDVKGGVKWEGPEFDALKAPQTQTVVRDGSTTIR